MTLGGGDDGGSRWWNIVAPAELQNFEFVRGIKVQAAGMMNSIMLKI